MKGLFIPPQFKDTPKPKLKIRTMQKLRLAYASVLLQNFRCLFSKPMKKITFDNNVRQIEELTGKIVDASYVTHENESNVFAKLVHFRSAKYIPINVFVNISEESRNSIEQVVASINTIFKRTYVKLPNIVVNFSPAKSAKLNPFAINLYETNPVYNIKGVTCSNLYHSSKVADINSVDISLASNMIADAKKIKIVFLHELMHAIFGFEDVYNPSKRKSTIMYGEYEKDNISVLSLNDVFIINALSWQKDLDEKQKLEIKAFYENYEKYIQNFMSLNQDLER